MENVSNLLSKELLEIANEIVGEAGFHKIDSYWEGNHPLYDCYVLKKWEGNELILEELNSALSDYNCCFGTELIDDKINKIILVLPIDWE